MAERRANREGSVYQSHASDCARPVGAKGQPLCKCRWQGSYIVGTKPNPNGGKPLLVRKKVSAATKSTAIFRLNELKEKHAADELPAKLTAAPSFQ